MAGFGWRAVAALLSALAAALALLTACVPALAADAPAVPPLRARVTDLTGTLSSAEQQALETKLAAWEQQTTNQLAVLIVPTTQPETVEEYGIRVAEAWKLGQKGKDNGALLLVAKNDRRMRIEVGYGLEGELPDVTARRIIGDTIAPYFAKGQFAAGIDAGVDRIIAVVSGTEPPSPGPAPQRRARSGGVSFEHLILFLLIGVTVIGAILRSILGKVGGGLAGAGIAGGAVWLFAGSIAFGVIAGIIAFVLIALVGIGGRGGPGMWIPRGGGWSGGGGFGGGGGGFSGGGGGFGGGGSSGGW